MNIKLSNGYVYKIRIHHETSCNPYNTCMITNKHVKQYSGCTIVKVTPYNPDGYEQTSSMAISKARYPDKFNKHTGIKLCLTKLLPTLNLSKSLRKEFWENIFSKIKLVKNNA